MESFFQIGEITLEGLVSSREFSCFSTLVNIIHWALYTEEWTDVKVLDLDNAISEYKKEFVELYGSTKENVRGKSTCFSILSVHSYPNHGCFSL